MSSHRIFAHLAFERGFGHAAIKALNQAIIDRDHFASATTWPNETLFTDRNDAEVATMRAELDQIAQDHIRDVLNGPASALFYAVTDGTAECVARRPRLARNPLPIVAPRAQRADRGEHQGLLPFRSRTTIDRPCNLPRPVSPAPKGADRPRQLARASDRFSPSSPSRSSPERQSRRP